MISRVRKIISELHISKKVTVILTIVLLLLVVVSGVFFSIKYWNNYESGYINHFSYAKSSINGVIIQASDDNKKPADKLNEIIKIKNELTEENKTNCYIAPILEWQKVIKNYDKKIGDCKKKQKQMDLFLRNLNNITTYLEFERRVSTIIQQANKATDENNQVNRWNEVEAIWNKSIGELNEIPNTERFSDVKTATIEKITDLASSWSELSSANADKSMKKFTEASLGLNKAYESLSTISDASQAMTTKLISDLGTSYNNL